MVRHIELRGISALILGSRSPLGMYKEVVLEVQLPEVIHHTHNFVYLSDLLSHKIKILLYKTPSLINSHPA